jgi:hypothetical protein
MAKRSDYKSKRERVKVLDEVVKKALSQSETVRIVLLRDMKLNYTGKVTGKVYRFDGAGSVLPVDVKDKDKMLEKHGGACCEGSGSNKPHPYFAIV